MMKFRAAFAAVVGVAFGLVQVLGARGAVASSHHMFEDEANLATSGGMDAEGRWNGENSPMSWGTVYNYDLNELATEAHTEGFQPWSDIYWPTNQAGIAARGNWPGNNGFKYRLYSEYEVRSMSLQKLALLSPAEKYDIFMGRFDYPTVREIRAGTDPHAEYWMGICHGWSPAAINHAEPAAVTVTSASGIAVPFGSDDVKALMDQYYADNGKADHFLGTKCQAGEGGNIFRRIASPFLRGPSCDDTNAGALHVILANEIGIKHKGFVADVDRWREVWNQPVYGYKTWRGRAFRGASRGSAAGTVREELVHTEMYYADELDKASWSPVVGTPAYKSGTEKYDYWLELDAYGRILGGSWVSSARPDFLWTVPKLEFTGYMSGINQIYRPAGK